MMWTRVEVRFDRPSVSAREFAVTTTDRAKAILAVMAKIRPGDADGIHAITLTAETGDVNSSESRPLVRV